MITPKVIAHLHTVDTTGTSHQTIGTAISCESTNHLKGFNIKAFKELLDPRLVRLYVFRTFLLPGNINLNRRLERTPKCRSTVCKSFIRLEFWQRLNGTLRPRPHLIHVGLQIGEIIST